MTLLISLSQMRRVRATFPRLKEASLRKIWDNLKILQKAGELNENERLFLADLESEMVKRGLI